jgi:hypothetical protein
MIGIGLLITVMLFPPVSRVIEPMAVACAGGVCDDGGGDDD